MGRVRRRTWVEAERRRHRSLAALTALTILAGVFASMVGREASPAAALDARRLTDIASVDNQTFAAEGGVADVAISADGNWMAIATTASLADIDDEIPPDNPDVCSPTCPDNDMDVYVVATSGLGPARLITDDQHPVGAVFWTVIPDIDISGDGRWVSWVMVDESSIILFAPPISGSKASPAAVPPGSNDVDGGRDVFVAEVDPDGDQNLNTSPESFDGHIGAGPFQLASPRDADGVPAAPRLRRDDHRPRLRQPQLTRRARRARRRGGPSTALRPGTTIRALRRGSETRAGLGRRKVGQWRSGT